MGDILRQSTCNQCLHGQAVGTNYRRTYCRITKREGRADRACRCEKFAFRLTGSSDAVSEAGFKYRSKQLEDYRTRNQWADAGYQVKQGQSGHEMHPTVASSKTYIYFLPQEVEPIEDTSKCCANCIWREGHSCPVAGGYVSLHHHCSEWKG